MYVRLAPEHFAIQVSLLWPHAFYQEGYSQRVTGLFLVLERGLPSPRRS